MILNLGASPLQHLPRELMETAVNRALALDPKTRTRLAQLVGKIIRLEITAPPLTLDIAPQAEGIRLLPAGTRVDVSLRAGAMDFLRIVRNAEDMDALRSLQIDGDLALGQQFQRIVQGFNIDWEEQLSHVLGDVAAYQLARALRGGAQFAQNAFTAFARDIGEYAQYESGVLASRAEVAGFLTDVDTLRADVDRLSARIALLQAKRP